jgi:hypothetical protein
MEAAPYALPSSPRHTRAKSDTACRTCLPVLALSLSSVTTPTSAKEDETHLITALSNLAFDSSVVVLVGHPGVASSSLTAALVSSSILSTQACRSSLREERWDRGTPPPMEVRREKRMGRVWGMRVWQKIEDDGPAILVCWTLIIWERGYGVSHGSKKRE